MKNIIYFALILALIACQEAPKDYVSISGVITNQNSDSLLIRKKGFTKRISVNADGSFKDTLKVEPGMYSLYDGTEGTSVFLKNGYDLRVTLDTKQFDETVKYEGIGAEQSNFLAQKVLLEEELLDIEALVAMDSVARATELIAIEEKFRAYHNEAKGIDTAIINGGLSRIDRMMKAYKNYIEADLALKRELPEGADSPVFNNYENFDGSSTSLESLQGKFVYIDVWATWCGPCIAEIPALKQLEEDYRDKNISFVSISIDEAGRHGGSDEVAHAKWKQMVAEEQLRGIQLFAPNGWKSDFVEAYKIYGIPRFILIDPLGKIVSASAPRPSSAQLIELFKAKGI